MIPRTAHVLPAAGVCALLLSGCATTGLTLPSGAGTPFPAFADAYAEAAAECRDVKTIRGTMSLSGRAGSTRLRGQVDAGFAAPADLRLEGRAPFGQPLFILVARDNVSTLVLPRDNRVLRGAPPAEIVEALAGVALSPSELRSVVAGCGFGAAAPSAGRSFDNGWIAVEAGDSTVYLRQLDGRWRTVAASRDSLTVEYADFASGRPARIRLRTPASDGAPADIGVRLSDVDVNVPLGAEVFRVEVPAGADPLTLDELRRAGPLGDPR